MAHPAMSKFFVPVRAVLGLLVIVGAAVVGYVAVWPKYRASHELNAAGAALTGVLVLVGLAVIWTAFVVGCGVCRRRFTDLSGSFALDAYDTIHRALRSGDLTAIEQLAEAPPAGRGAYVSVAALYCPACKRIAQIRLTQTEGDGPSAEQSRLVEQSVVGAIAVAWVKMLSKRPARGTPGVDEGGQGER